MRNHFINVNHCLIFVFFLLISSPVIACKCGGLIPPPCVEFELASAVFIGEVTEIKTQLDIDGSHAIIHFSVEKSYKGITANEAITWTSHGSDCDLGLKKGKKYFVYAFRNEKQNRLHLGICSRINEISFAKEDVAYADNFNSSKSNITLIGMEDYYSSYLQGAEIIVKKGDREFRAVADKRGGFQLELPQSGKYKVTVIGAKGLAFLSHMTSWTTLTIQGRPAIEFEWEMVEGKCTFIDFSRYMTILKEK